MSFIHQHFPQFSPLQTVLWFMYLAAAVALPIYHIIPVLKYLRGNNGIGDACIRTEVIQCGWRLPALLFSVFVVPSLPLFLSIFLDMLGRIARFCAMHGSNRRWQTRTAAAVARADVAFSRTFPIPTSPPIHSQVPDEDSRQIADSPGRFGMHADGDAGARRQDARCDQVARSDRVRRQYRSGRVRCR